MGCVPSNQVTDCQYRPPRSLTGPHKKMGCWPSSQISVSRQREIDALLEKETCWDFDIFLLERLTCKRPLQYLAKKTFDRFGVLAFLQCGEYVMANWLECIEINYDSNIAYHNSTHAADVFHAMAYFLSCPRIKDVMDDVDVVAALIAAIIHDIGHHGKINAFLINVNDPLAVFYKDTLTGNNFYISERVLENYHVNLAFQLTSKYPQCNIFQNLDRDKFRTLAQMIFDMVLSTDMKKHFEHTSNFKNHIIKFVKSETNSKISLNEGKFFPLRTHLSSPENKQLIQIMMMKCADISNPSRPFDLCRQWTSRICGEYWAQTDEEKERGLPVTLPMYDRKNCNVAETQCGFIDFMVMDLYEDWHSFCEIPQLMINLHTNYKLWKEMAEKYAK